MKINYELTANFTILCLKNNVLKYHKCFSLDIEKQN